MIFNPQIGVWRWAYSGDEADYTQWLYDQPDGGTDQNCVVKQTNLVGLTRIVMSLPMKMERKSMLYVKSTFNINKHYSARCCES